MIRGLPGQDDYNQDLQLKHLKGSNSNYFIAEFLFDNKWNQSLGKNQNIKMNAIRYTFIKQDTEQLVKSQISLLFKVSFVISVIQNLIRFKNQNICRRKKSKFIRNQNGRITIQQIPYDMSIHFNNY
ncbi:unnamed protein product [Paramecium octaurelia]|uniref:Uncharacterized protein n=1 Tax=Paramecium octaurelia TaxID=43137 RepID=A0A8S1SC32_PAROT|nr:unnamed protein product [Paramecium octaurelia]